MLALAPGWELAVERGPDWLFVKVANPDGDASEAPELADCIWSLLQQHLTHRLVLELEEIDVLRSNLVGQLVKLHRRIAEQGGVMRLCGLSAHNRRVLRTCRLEDRLPVYEHRMDAVLCRPPSKPR